MPADRLIYAQDVVTLTRMVSEGEADISWENIEATIRAWRIKGDPTTRLNCPNCKKRSYKQLTWG